MRLSLIDLFFQSGIITKIVLHDIIFEDILAKICSLVQRDAFTLGIINLGLLRSSSNPHQLMGSSGLNVEQELEHDKKDFKSSKSNKKKQNSFTVCNKL